MPGSMTSLLLSGAAGGLVLAAPWAMGRPLHRRRVPGGRLRAQALSVGQARSWLARARGLQDTLPLPLRPLWQFLVLDALGPGGRGLQERLIHAGKDPRGGLLWVRAVQATCVLLFSTVALFGAWASGLSPWSGLVIAALVGCTGLLVPLLELSWQARKRRDNLRRELVPALHMLGALVGAGLSLEEGLRRVAEGRGALAGELHHALTLRDTVGLDLDEALRQAAERCATNEVTTALRRIVIARRKSGTVGARTPIAEGLLQLAEATRVALRAERRVRKGRALLAGTVLVVLLGLPPLLLAIGYPLVVFFLQGAR